MNQTFSFQRWSLLVGRHWAENKRRYILSVIAFTGLLFLFYVFVMSVVPERPLRPFVQLLVFYFSLFLTGPFYASQFYRELGSRPKAIEYLMIPASTLEKFLCGLLYTIILFPLVFLAAYYLVDVLAVAIANAVHPFYTTVQEGESGVFKESVINVITVKDVMVSGSPGRYLFPLFFAGQSAALLGSVYFVRYSYIKTAICAAVLLLGFLFLEEYVFQLFLPEGRHLRSIGVYEVIMPEGTNRMVQLPHWVNSLLNVFFTLAFPPLFWVVTYFRLQEKEV